MNELQVSPKGQTCEYRNQLYCDKMFSWMLCPNLILERMFLDSREISITHCIAYNTNFLSVRSEASPPPTALNLSSKLTGNKDTSLDKTKINYLIKTIRDFNTVFRSHTRQLLQTWYKIAMVNDVKGIPTFKPFSRSQRGYIWSSSLCHVRLRDNLISKWNCFCIIHCKLR